LENHVVKGNLEIFPLLLGLKGEEGYQQILSLVENHRENCEQNQAQQHNYVTG
jgi:hypothetical protein